MSAYLQTINLYKQEGYEIRTSMNPMHFSISEAFLRVFSTDIPFTHALSKDICLELRAGGGINNTELFFFENLRNTIPDVKNIFIIGNAFGYSTIFLSLLFPDAKVVAMDAGIQGDDNMLGINLTQSIIKRHNLNAVVELAFSPKDNHSVVSKHFSDPIDLVFIDGLHTNEQLLLDFEGTRPYCNEHTIWTMHDVVNYKMQKAFFSIANALASTHISKILYRTQSGMGFAVPQQNTNATALLDAFSESDQIIEAYVRIGKAYDKKLLRMLKGITPNFIKKGVKKCLRRL